MVQRVGVDPQQEPPPLPTPSFLKIVSAGQNPVKADWIRLTPTKAVSRSQYSLTQWAREMLRRTMVPAMMRMAFSIVIVVLSRVL